MNINDLAGMFTGFAGGVSAIILQFIASNPYPALIILMALEGASLPLPSEVIIPAAGFFAAKGMISLPLAFIAVLIGNSLGQIIDYSLGYYIGKEVIYKNLKKFRVKETTLRAFDKWFERNGILAVFISRMLPEVRSIMSFPAGFAKMKFSKFMLWSMAGSALWDFILILFGYYLLSGSDAYIVGTAVGVFILILYIIYRIAMSRLKRRA